MANTLNRSEALGTAIRMENEGIEFYQKAAEQTANPLGRKMFLSLVSDERRHVEIFQEMAAQEGAVPAAEELDASNPLKRMGSIFKDAAGKAQKDTADDDIRAIDIALRMEQESYFFYTNAAKSTGNADERRILEKIAEEENIHFRILNDTRLYLTYPQMWHIIQEKPLIDGG